MTPSAEQIFLRAKAWGALIHRGFVEPEYGQWVVPESHEELADRAPLGDEERRLLRSPGGELSVDDLHEATWYCEALAVALWTLGLNDFPPQDSDVTPLRMSRIIAEAKPEEIELRSADDLDEGLLTVFWVHRRIYAFLRGHKKMRLTTWLANSGMDVPKFLRLKRGDLMFDGLPVGRAQVAALPYGSDFQKVTGLRLRAMRWILGKASFEDGTASPYTCEDDEAMGAASLYKVESTARKLDGRGGLASHSSAWYGQLPRLAEAAASSNFDIEGLTALHCALLNGQGEAVRALVEEHGVPVDVSDGKGNTPLVTALKSRSEEAVSLLLQLGAKPDGPAGTTPPIFCAIATGVQECVSLLLEKGADVEAKDKAMRTPLIFAALRGEYACVQELLKAGAKVKAKDPRGNTALHWAAEKGQAYIVRALLEAKAKLERPNDAGHTPMARAAYFGHSVCVMALLDAGASVLTEAKNGQTPLHYACRLGMVDVVQRLLDSGADHGAASENGYTPIHAAALGGEDNCVKLLIRAGAEVNVSDGQGMTPFHTACNRGYKSMAKILLAAGAEYETRTENLETPLHVTAFGHYPMECLGMLLKAGANPMAQDKDGCTPLHLVTRAGHQEAAQLLVAAGGHNQLKDSEGMTPLEWAKERDNPELVKLLDA